MIATARGALLLIVWLVPGATAFAEPVGVKDHAHLFKPETLQKADELIREIQEQFQTHLLIETVEALPEEQQKQLKSRNLNAAGRRRLFSEWAAKEARKAGADGIYVWICKNPKRTEVVLGSAVPAELFTSRNGDKLLDYLTGWRFDKSPDAELVRGVTYVRDTLESATRPTVWPWAVGLVVAVLAVWGVIMWIRNAEMAAPPANEPAENPEPSPPVQEEGEPSDYHTHSDRGPV